MKVLVIVKSGDRGRQSKFDVSHVVGVANDSDEAMKILKDLHRDSITGIYKRSGIKADAIGVTLELGGKSTSLMYKLVEADFEPPADPEEYYFKTKGWLHDTCVEPCNVMEGVKIGSVSCQECEFNAACGPNRSFNRGPEWISCHRLKEATSGL